MPIYEYTCPSCGTSFEKLLKEPQQEMPCPACGAQARRTVSLPAAGSAAPEGGCGGSGFT